MSISSVTKVHFFFKLSFNNLSRHVHSTSTPEFKENIWRNNKPWKRRVSKKKAENTIWITPRLFMQLILLFFFWGGARHDVETYEIFNFFLSQVVFFFFHHRRRKLFVQMKFLFNVRRSFLFLFFFVFFIFFFWSLSASFLHTSPYREKSWMKISLVGGWSCWLWSPVATSLALTARKTGRRCWRKLGRFFSIYTVYYKMVYVAYYIPAKRSWTKEAENRDNRLCFLRKKFAFCWLPLFPRRIS